MSGTTATRAQVAPTESAFYTLVADYCARQNGPGIGWTVAPSRDSSHPWIVVRPDDTSLPSQGWKLHISANSSTAMSVLRQALPVLIAERASFKVADSLQTLSLLNEGEGGFSQVGKFITVYPSDDAHAVRLATVLDAATRGLDGPPIPSDRPLAPGSLVYYRFGAFDERYTQTALGLILPVVSAPDGTTEPDYRGVNYRVPDWVEDPFLAADVTSAPSPPRQLIGERYLIIAGLHWSPRSAIYLAMDTVDPGPRVLKRARRAAAVGLDHLDAIARLRREADVLSRLAGDPRFPAIYDLIEQDGDLYLAMEDVEGERLETRVAGVISAGRNVPSRHIVAWGRELAAALDSIHRHGYVYRDLKSANVFVTADGGLRLLDFDSAVALTSRDGFSRGTRGYASPQQDAGEPPDVRDDVYSLGALLYFVATGAEPSLAPDAFSLPVRPLPSLNAALPSSLVSAIVRCLEPNKDDRFPLMAAVDTALAAIEREISVPETTIGNLTHESEAEARLRSRSLARRLGESLIRAAQPAPNGQGLVWGSRHPVGSGIRSRDINTGSAGALLAFAEFVDVFPDLPNREVLAQGAAWLREAPALEGPPLPGLYVGEAGIGAALLRAGQVLGDDELIAAAAARGQWISSLPYGSPDLMNGTSGRLRFHLWLWDETAVATHLRAAIACGESLLAAAEPIADGLRWPIPPGYEDLSGRACLGYAHGAAGIGDALLDLFEATGDDRFSAAAHDAARWLTGLAVPALDDDSGLAWPDVEDAAPNGSFWCRGATGIGRFFLHAAELQVFPEAADVAARAALTVARGARWIGPTQCHGLAGNIELLLDAYQTTTDRSYLIEARSLASLLESFASERDGSLVWPSESPLIFTPDYMVGYAGVEVCLLRLADPEHRPYQLSRRGFRFREPSRS